jgi:hypothetical protein
MRRLMKTALPLLLLTLCLTACLKGSSPTRPATAMEYCEQLRKKYFEGKTQCAPVTDAARLTLFQAAEAAVVQRRAPEPGAPGGETLVEMGWVAYTSQQPNNGTLGGVLQLAGRSLAGVALLETHSDPARVGVFVTRGEISAAKWDELNAQVAALTAAP